MADARLENRSAWLVGRVVETHSLVLRTVGGDRAGEAAANRYMGNDAVDPAAILAPAIARTAEAAAGRRVVVAQDTTEVNFAGRARRRQGLGPGGDGESPGFFIHPLVVIEADEEAVIGIAGAQIWTRGQDRTGDHHRRPAEEKESRRWLDGARAAADVLAKAVEIIVVGDRESDVYGLLAGRPATVDLVVRAAQDRALGDGTCLKETAAGWEAIAGCNVAVAARPAGSKGGPRPARTAHVEVRAGRIEVLRPKSASRTEPARVTLGLVEVVEVGAPDGVEPLVWRLLTTLPLGTPGDALEVVRLYRLRWRVEEVFRVLKKDGLDLEASQVRQASRLFNLAAVGLVASVRILQLTDARNGSPRPATDIIGPHQIAPVAVIGASLERATQRQRNPWPRGSLAWLAWIVARLGGWNCYYREPGPKTMANGWRRLAERLACIASLDQAGLLTPEPAKDV
ncbi:MAG: IS4 family transposase [Hyphomicrobiales bacterium]|nr:IS4 family transposase [Hyphomicrobiales bacterium]